jgi:hypothetical protein
MNLKAKGCSPEEDQPGQRALYSVHEEQPAEHKPDRPEHRHPALLSYRARKRKLFRVTEFFISFSADPLIKL